MNFAAVAELSARRYVDVLIVRVLTLSPVASVGYLAQEHFVARVTLKLRYSD